MVVVELFGKALKISRKCFVHELAFVRGDVEMGGLSSVWP